MTRMETQYINALFVPSIGSEVATIINASNGEVIGEALLGNEEDVIKAIEAAQNV